MNRILRWSVCFVMGFSAGWVVLLLLWAFATLNHLLITGLTNYWSEVL
jgi:hypothetical protein